MKTLSPEWPLWSWHFPARLTNAMTTLTRQGHPDAERLGDAEDAKYALMVRVCAIYERPETTTEQRRWLRFRWARYCRLRRWNCQGDWSVMAEVRQIECDIACVEDRLARRPQLKAVA